ncbi:MAG TPA: isochorismatase family protein [Chloroflexota bacterium]|nr:isochorismatase family protein [Chloroflexota bacterium]
MATQTDAGSTTTTTTISTEHGAGSRVAPAPALRLRGRHWETPSLDGAGWAETPYDLRPEETAFVALHLWNVGDAGGPPVPDGFFVDMGTRAAQEESVAIAGRYIAPAIAASRAAGLPIFHVEPADIALKYDSARHMLEPEAAPPARPAAPRPPEANPGWNRERNERSHGAGYSEWAGWGQMRIMASCDAEPGDQVIVTGAQFDRILRSRGIKNLVYTGFATNMCILDSAAATREMLGFGYRIFLIREATLAVEYPDTFDSRMMTRSALKYFELKIGDTIGFDEYVAACRSVAAGAAGG